MSRPCDCCASRAEHALREVQAVLLNDSPYMLLVALSMIEAALASLEEEPEPGPLDERKRIREIVRTTSLPAMNLAFSLPLLSGYAELLRDAILCAIDEARP